MLSFSFSRCVLDVDEGAIEVVVVGRVVEETVERVLLGRGADVGAASCSRRADVFAAW